MAFMGIFVALLIAGYGCNGLYVDISEFMLESFSMLWLIP
jgi:hypothetical protein